MKEGLRRVYNGYIAIIHLFVDLAVVFSLASLYVAFVVHHVEFIKTLPFILIVSIIFAIIPLMFKAISIDWMPQLQLLKKEEKREVTQRRRR
jgi:hypothetical protein